jgi:cell division protein FtsI (penicillin-binding protein 3)
MRNVLRGARLRSIFLLALACFLIGLAEARLLHLQVLSARAPSDSAIYRSFSLEEEGRRGELRDARGGQLATTVREVDVRVWTSGIPSAPGRDAPRRLADRLADLCGVEPAETLKMLSRPRSWKLLATGLRDPAVIADLRRLSRQSDFRAVSLETRHVRDYPRGPLLAPLLGWVGWSEEPRDPEDPLFRSGGAMRGAAGLEALLDTELSPARGRRLVRRDGLQRELADPDLEEFVPRDGATVELTIEPLAQLLVEESADAAVAEFEPDWVQILVLDPNSGDVKAAAQRPTPPSPRPSMRRGEDPRQALALHEFMPAQRRYPPGSSFKPIMLGLVLERGLATPETLVDCENGAATFGPARVIHDVHPHSLLTATDVLVESSNIGMAKLVLSLVPPDAGKGGPAYQPVLDHLVRLGFDRPVSGLPGEQGGLLPARASMTRNWSLASLAFGQEIGVTALQMATACAAVANGGAWRPARFVRAVRDDEGAPLPLAEPAPRRAFSPGTAASLRAMLEQVVERGASRRWKPLGWSVAGKTGTAEDERNGKAPVTSYWCFAPVHDPAFLVLVVLYRPRHGRFAAENAAKVAAPLLGRLLERFEIPQDRPEERLGRGGLHLVVSQSVGEGG